MMRVGTVKFFDQNKGFGFVINNIDGSEIFVHARNVDPHALPLQSGDLVEFDIANASRGPIAIRVRFAQ